MALTTPGGTTIVINWAVKHDRMCTTFREHGVCRKREKNQECLYPEDRHLPNDDAVRADDQYKKVGVYKNYLTCPHKHPWDDKWGKKHEVYLKAKMLPAPAGTSAPVIPTYLVCPALADISRATQGLSDTEDQGAINGVLTGETDPSNNPDMGSSQVTDVALHPDQVEVTAGQGSHVITNDNMANVVGGTSNSRDNIGDRRVRRPTAPKVFAPEMEEDVPAEEMYAAFLDEEFDTGSDTNDDDEGAEFAATSLGELISDELSDGTEDSLTADFTWEPSTT